MDSRDRSSNRHYWTVSAWIALAFLGMLLFYAGRAETDKGGRTIRAAAASDLKFAMEELVGEFRRSKPEINVLVSYGSSGNFYAEILQQAPFDIYFSADVFYPGRLSEQGVTMEGSLFTYAIGRLVLWVPDSSPIDVRRLQMASLRHEAVRHIAIANPKHAPYGKAALAALHSTGFYESVRDRLVLGENIAQTFQFVQSGASQIGIVAISLVLAPGLRDQGTYWEIPLDAYPPMEQGGVILKRAGDPEAAWDLRSFVLGPRGREILSRFGFYLPGE